MNWIFFWHNVITQHSLRLPSTQPNDSSVFFLFISFVLNVISIDYFQTIFQRVDTESYVLICIFFIRLITVIYSFFFCFNVESLLWPPNYR